MDLSIFAVSGPLKGGCVLGQTAVNLGVDATDSFNGNNNLFRQLNRFHLSTDDWLESKWYFLTDYDALSGLGEIIIHWNDLEKSYTDEEEDAYFKKHPESFYFPRKYVLETYSEVAAMAYDILKPFFAEKIKLVKKEWKLA